MASRKPRVPYFGPSLQRVTIDVKATQTGVRDHLLEKARELQWANGSQEMFAGLHQAANALHEKMRASVQADHNRVDYRAARANQALDLKYARLERSVMGGLNQALKVHGFKVAKLIQPKARAGPLRRVPHTMSGLRGRAEMLAPFYAETAANLASAVTRGGLPFEQAVPPRKTRRDAGVSRGGTSRRRVANPMSRDDALARATATRRQNADDIREAFGVAPGGRMPSAAVQRRMLGLAPGDRMPSTKEKLAMIARGRT